MCQDSRDINVDDALSAKAVLEQESDGPALDLNEPGSDSENQPELAGPRSDQEEGGTLREEAADGELGGVDEAQAQEEEEVDAGEDSAKESLRDQVDDLLPDVLEETDEVAKNFADILEIDPTAVRNRTHDGDYHHPFHRPNIVEDGEYSKG